MDDGRWRGLAEQQRGMLAVRQLTELGVPRGVLRHRLATGHWMMRTEHVLSTTTGELDRHQQMWLGVLHAGNGALVGGLTAGEVHGLRNWHRDDVTVLVRDEWAFDPVPGIAFFRTRRPLGDLASSRNPWRGTPPVCQLEPAVLLWAGYKGSVRAGQGLLAAAVQQRLTEPERLRRWIGRLRPLRRAREFRRVLVDIEGGAQSAAELDVRRMCRTFGLPLPRRQRPRRDRDGRWRFTDCEWLLPDGRTVVLEVDGAFHLEFEQYAADVRRQRRLTTTSTIVVRCTSIELRDTPASVAQDLAALGVCRSCA